MCLPKFFIIYFFISFLAIHESKHQKNTITPGVDIDLFPADKDCLETDEKSSQLEIHQDLRNKNVNTKNIKQTFLDLNGVHNNDKSNHSHNNKRKRKRKLLEISESDEENEYPLSDNTSLNSSHSATHNKDDLLSPILSSIDHSQSMKNDTSSNSLKQKRNKKRDIQFIPPWKLK